MRNRLGLNENLNEKKRKKKTPHANSIYFASYLRNQIVAPKPMGTDGVGGRHFSN